MFIYVLLFVAGLVLLIKGGDWFVDGASGIAHRFHIPEIIIGATVVSIGTTLPEVMVSATGAVTGHGEMAYGNAVGSVICNTALIAALTMAIMPGNVDKKSLRVPVLFFFISATIYLLVSYIFGEFSRTVGIIFLGIFVIYIILTIFSAREQMKNDFLSNKDEHDNKAQSPDGNENIFGLIIWIVSLAVVSVLVTFQSDEITGLVLLGISIVYGVMVVINSKDHSKAAIWKDIIFLVMGATIIAFGADLLVDNGTLIAKALGVPEAVIALTFVALGTSLPELVTAIMALVKGRGSLSLGNIIGANLFNLVLVTGVAATLAPFGIPAGSTIFGINSSLVVDLPVMFGVMALMCIPPLIKGKLKRWQGITLLCVYVAFCVYQFII